MTTDERDPTDRVVEDDRTCSRLTLEIWHPDCWTLEVTAETDAGLLGHGVHEIGDRAVA